jgi:hypothetical protein
MAETMTYDPGTDTVTTENNLTEAEKEALVVGEEMEAQQEQMLAGKYKNAQELEKAYIELEKKLGSDGKEEKPEAEAENESKEVLQEESEEGTKEPSPAVALVTEASNEYYANDGKLSEDTIEKFSSMSSKDLVSAYMDIVKNNPQDQAAPAQDIADADINKIKNGVGGEKQYDNMIRWADQNLDKQASEAFDNVVSTGNVQMIQLAVAGLKAQYDEANGYEGRMLSGKAPLKSGDVYRSQPELVAAMSDPRYDTDPAYRRDVMEKLDRSDMNF